MKAFMDENFLLNSETAQLLYHEYAKEMPIIDYHCHISPKEIAEDIRFDNITQVWLGGDHYKWRLMRANGIDEAYITGKASDYEKFVQWAQTLELAIGNPLYAWSHLELKRYFGYEGVLGADTAKEVWELCNQKLAKPEMSARSLIANSKVKLLCTTDDPVDSLEYHQQLAKEDSFSTKVLPAFRPDEALGIEKSSFQDYLKKLSKVCNLEINSFEAITQALKSRIEYFTQNGCRTADHGMEFVMYYPASRDEIEAILKKRLEGMELSRLEILQYKTALLLFLGQEYHHNGWVMQLHYGVKRDNNTRFYQQIGANTGFDCIDNSSASSAQLADFLNALDVTDQLPKTIVYSLNPMDNVAIDTVIGCFQDSSAIGKLQHGSAWWFNDHRLGMQEHMQSLANNGLLANFVGMLTDSRSFLSYTRHEYFRRILCDLLGQWVDKSEYPSNMQLLQKMVQNISFNNALSYFGFKL